MRFKTFRISKIDGDYEKLYYHDNKFYKKYVTTDDWWDLEYLPTEHDYYDFQLFINMLTAYSEEHNNPLAVQFEIIVKPFKLKEPAFGHTHEDVTRPQHLDDIIEVLIRALEFHRSHYDCPSFLTHANIICKKVNKRKVRKRTHIPRGLRHEVFKRDGYKCVECGASKDDGATLHVDHKIPVSKGGTDELDNLQTLCSECNLNKSDVIQ